MPKCPVGSPRFPPISTGITRSTGVSLGHQTIQRPSSRWPATQVWFGMSQPVRAGRPAGGRSSAVRCGAVGRRLKCRITAFAGNPVSSPVPGIEAAIPLRIVGWDGSAEGHRQPVG